MIAIGSAIFAVCGNHAFALSVTLPGASGTPPGRLCELAWRTALLEDLGRQGAALAVYHSDPASNGPARRPLDAVGQVGAAAHACAH